MEESNSEPLHYTLNIIFEYEGDIEPCISKDSLEDLLTVEDNVRIRIRQHHLEPVEEEWWLSASYDVIENIFDYKVNCDPNCTFTVKFGLAQCQEPYRIVEDGSTNNPPFFTIHIPLQLDKGPVIKTNIFVVLDLVTRACEEFKLKVAERIGLTEVLPAWTKLLARQIKIRAYGQQGYLFVIDLSEPNTTDIKQRVNNTIVLEIGDMLDLHTFGEFRTFFEKSAQDRGINLP